MSGNIHKNLAEGRWFQIPLADQLGNIGSEISRAGKQQGKDEDLFWAAVERAMELFDLTISDKRWSKRLMEIGRARDVFADAILGGKEYHSSFENIQPYFDQFALVARG